MYNRGRVAHGVKAVVLGVEWPVWTFCRRAGRSRGGGVGPSASSVCCAAEGSDLLGGENSTGSADAPTSCWLCREVIGCGTRLGVCVCKEAGILLGGEAPGFLDGIGHDGGTTDERRPGIVVVCPCDRGCCDLLSREGVQGLRGVKSMFCCGFFATPISNLCPGVWGGLSDCC